MCFKGMVQGAKSKDLDGVEQEFGRGFVAELVEVLVHLISTGSASCNLSLLASSKFFRTFVT